MIGTAIRLGLRELWANRMRSTLTALGIVIGVASVLILVTLGRGVSLQIEREFDAMGGNLVFVMPGGRLSGAPADRQPFTEGDLKTIRLAMAGVRSVTGLSQLRERLTHGNKSMQASVLGTDNDFFELRKWAIARGRPFSHAELRTGHKACIIGADVASALAIDDTALGARIRIRDMHCSVIGVLQAKGKGLFGDTDDTVLILPRRTMQRRLLGHRGIDSLEIAMHSAEAMPEAAEQIRVLMRERRSIRAGAPDSFTVTDLRTFTGQVQDILETLTLFLGAVALVSLLVGGVGVMNIMLVAVAERTREIGIRLSIGAQQSDVMIQFLAEAIILCLLGCLTGIVIGFGIAAVAAASLHVPFVPDASAVFHALAFSALFGIAFGYMPARRAARLDPIEALRFE